MCNALDSLPLVSGRRCQPRRNHGSAAEGRLHLLQFLEKQPKKQYFKLKLLNKALKFNAISFIK
jgi:hypothetical protein